MSPSSRGGWPDLGSHGLPRLTMSFGLRTGHLLPRSMSVIEIFRQQSQWHTALTLAQSLRTRLARVKPRFPDQAGLFSQYPLRLRFRKNTREMEYRCLACSVEVFVSLRAGTDSCYRGVRMPVHTVSPEFALLPDEEFVVPPPRSLVIPGHRISIVNRPLE